MEENNELTKTANSKNRNRKKTRFNANNERQCCVSCDTRYTSEWRAGPDGKTNLCNACGLAYRQLLKKDAIHEKGLKRVSIQTLTGQNTPDELDKNEEVRISTKKRRRDIVEQKIKEYDVANFKTNNLDSSKQLVKKTKQGQLVSFFNAQTNTTLIRNELTLIPRSDRSPSLEIPSESQKTSSMKICNFGFDSYLKRTHVISNSSSDLYSKSTSNIPMNENVSDSIAYKKNIDKTSEEEYRPVDEKFDKGLSV